jgi:pyridoxine 5-phosphate synthase
MPYLEVNLDPFIELGRISGLPLANPVNLLSYAEAAGASGICLTYKPEIEQLNNLALLRAISSCRINMRVPADMQLLQKVILLHPDIVTIVDAGNDDATVQIPSKQIKELVNSVLNVGGLGVALRLKPEVKQLKEAYQLGIDEVEVATNELARHNRQIPFLECLEKITHAIHIGSRNNLRISAGGSLNRHLLREIVEVIDLEFISVGRALLSQALIFGFESALRELMKIIQS